MNFDILTNNRLRNIFWILSIIIILLLTLISTYGYSTEESIVLNKLSSASNLSDSQQVVFFDLIAKDDNTISNETILIEDIKENLLDLIQDINTSNENNFDLLWEKIKDLETNISLIVPENDELAILEAKKDLILTIQNQQEKKSDPFDLFLEQYLNPEKEKSKTIINQSSTNLNNYFTKDDINALLEDYSTTENLKESIQNIPTPIKQDLTSYVTRNNLLIVLIFVIGVIVTLFIMQIKPKLDKLDYLMEKIQKQEKQINKLEENKI